MKIKELTTKNVECLDPRSSLRQADRLMREAGVGGVPVVEDGQVLGVLTDRGIVALAELAARAAAAAGESSAATLVTGELSAVRTYRTALKKLGSGAAAGELRRIEGDHEKAVRLLRKGMSAPDRYPPAAPGLWRAFAEAGEDAAKPFGETDILKALKSGEEFEIRDYHQALDDARVSPRVKEVIGETLLPLTWSHVSALERRLQPEECA